MATEIDKDLLATLKQAKAGRPMQFAFLGKGTGGKLLAAKKLLPATVAEARKKEGGTLFRGRLVSEDGQLVFEVAKEPPANLAAQLKRTIKEHAGLTWDLEVRVKGDAEEEGAEAPVSKQEVLGRLQRLAPQVKAALAGPNAARVQALLGAINGLVKNNDFVQADKVLDELEPLVGGAPPAPPPPPPDAKAAVMKRLTALTAAIKAALAGPNAARVQTLFGAINGLIKNNDFAQAGKVLDELEPLLKAKPDGPAAPAPSPVEFAKIKLRWDAAKKTVAANLAALRKIVLEEDDDPETAKAVKKLDKVLQRFNEGLADTLDDLYNSADPEARAALRSKAGKIAQAYLDYLDDDPLVEHVEDNPFADTEVRDILMPPLDDLLSRLAV